MIQEIQSLIDEYLVWLRDQTALREVGNQIEITTPFLDRHNDHLQIYAKPENSNFLLSDDGYTIQDLQMSGCKLDSKKRKEMLETTLNGFGVQLRDDALTIKATRNSFSQRKHNLVQAMLAVNDMFYTATANVINLFFEDVASWLELNEIRCVPRVKFTGKSGYDHIFDFAIPKSKMRPERIVQTINRPTHDAAKLCAFGWTDTKDERPTDSQAYAILNDSEKDVAPAIISALESYDIRAVPWSQRDTIRPELTN